MNPFDVLKERGFIKQCSNERGLRKLLQKPGLVYYVGFDPTADSLHVGNLLAIMAMANLQRLGHIPIVIIGGATALIGDPSGKTEMRRMMSQKEIQNNTKKILSQLRRYLILDGKNGRLLDNSEWLVNLNYIEFLRDIGRHFKVNEMIKHEGYKLRLERREGLSFIEFNYQLLQAYDFLTLFGRYGCRLQMGGDDQWGNILAGINLIRRIKGEETFGLTFPLITIGTGQKMGKTESGAIWLDAKKTSAYDFYQYWINVDDRDVIRFLSLFTFLPMKEINALSKLKGAKLRQAKEILAFETTKLAHGRIEAKRAQAASRAAFAKTGKDQSALPTTFIKKTRLSAGIPIVDLLYKAGLVTSKSEARRLIKQAGAYINDKKISSPDMVVKENSLKNNQIMLRRGKKQYRRILVK